MATIGPLLRTDYKMVDKRDELHSVYGWLQGDSKKVPLVVDHGKPFGIVNERALVSRQMPQKAKLEQFTLVTRALSREATLEEAAARMAELRAPCLPVEDERGRLVGYVTAIDVARERGNQRRAADLALPIAALTESHTLGDAVHLFAKEYAPVLPVTGEDGGVRGVVARRDVLRWEFNNGSKGRKDAGGEKIHPLKDPVGGLMDTAPALVPAGAPFEDVLDALETNGYALVQGQGGGVMGLVTPESLMRTT